MPRDSLTPINKGTINFDEVPISVTARGALDGNFLNRNQIADQWWEEDNNYLMYETRSDGSYLIYEIEGDGSEVPMGFTSQAGIDALARAGAFDAGGKNYYNQNGTIPTKQPSSGGSAPGGSQTPPPAPEETPSTEPTTEQNGNPNQNPQDNQGSEQTPNGGEEIKDDTSTPTGNPNQNDSGNNGNGGNDGNNSNTIIPVSGDGEDFEGVPYSEIRGDILYTGFGSLTKEDGSKVYYYTDPDGNIYYKDENNNMIHSTYNDGSISVVLALDNVDRYRDKVTLPKGPSITQKYASMGYKVERLNEDNYVNIASLGGVPYYTNDSGTIYKKINDSYEPISDGVRYINLKDYDYYIRVMGLPSIGTFN